MLHLLTNSLKFNKNFKKKSSVNKYKISKCDYNKHYKKREYKLIVLKSAWLITLNRNKIKILHENSVKHN